MYLTDIAVHGKTDESGSLVDLDNEMLPSRTKNDMKGKNKWYWEEGFKGIKYANIAISRLDGAEYKDEAERNAVLGAAYFQRAYRHEVDASIWRCPLFGQRNHRAEVGLL